MQRSIGGVFVACFLLAAPRMAAQVPSRNDPAARAPRRTSEGLSRTQLEAQQACKNAIDTRAGYQARRVGTPVRHGAKQWDVPVTVRRDGTETMRVTCRYDGASGKVSLRPADQK